MRRFVLSHVEAASAGSHRGASSGLGRTPRLLVAGGIDGLDGVRVLRDAGAAGIIVGEAVFTARIDLVEALATAA